MSGSFGRRTLVGAWRQPAVFGFPHSVRDGPARDQIGWDGSGCAEPSHPLTAGYEVFPAALVRSEKSTQSEAGGAVTRTGRPKSE